MYIIIVINIMINKTNTSINYACHLRYDGNLNLCKFLMWLNTILRGSFKTQDNAGLQSSSCIGHKGDREVLQGLFIVLQQAPFVGRSFYDNLPVPCY